ncbi:MAG: hypothetical protein P1U90_15145, partial [Akkermansiaceae bacterium]|nr:hypothetical protein [Akkermansiaceae bacterium]
GMKLFLMTFFLLKGIVWGDELEVRAYWAGMSVLREAHLEVGGDEKVDYGKDDWLGEELKKVPFKSRFLKKGGRLRDCSDRVKELFAGEEVEIAAVYDFTGGKLVVEADEMTHLILADVLEKHLNCQMSTTVEVIVKEAGKEELLTVVSSLHHKGEEYEARSENGTFVIRGLADWERDSFYIEGWVEWKSTIEGAEFELKTSLMTMRESSNRIELGSVEGKRELVVVVSQERAFVNGVRFEEWILKEEGGAFLKKEQLEGDGPVFGKSLSRKVGVRRFDVPPGFIDFITWDPDVSGVDPDPFAANDPEEAEVKKLSLPFGGEHPALEGMSRYKLYDLAKLLRENGVNIREGDFAFYKANQSALLVKASVVDLELVDLIVQAYVLEGKSKMIRLTFRKFEAAGKFDQERLESKDYDILEMMGIEALPGKVATIRLGKDLILETQGHIDHRNEIVKVQVILSEEEQDLNRASFKTAITLGCGMPVVVQQVRKGKKWRAWVVTAEIVVVGVNR